jgi:hypothetical protein
VRNAGIVSVGALTAIGAAGVGQATNAEHYIEPTHRAVSSEDAHGARSVSNPNSVTLSKSEESDSANLDTSDKSKGDNETEKQLEYLEPAKWWPTSVKQNWLLIQNNASQYDLDPYLVATIVAEESGGQNINNPSGATGLMQIMPSTAQEIARLRHMAYYNMSDPAQNLDYGCWLLNYINEKYITSRGVELNSELGIAMLAVYYGDGVGAGELWAKNGYSPQLLSMQAQQVTPLWQAMYRDKDKPKSEVYTIKRGEQ